MIEMNKMKMAIQSREKIKEKAKEIAEKIKKEKGLL
jgi:hypothetical protein